jgi:two-component system sensor histidine kinase HydH
LNTKIPPFILIGTIIVLFPIFTYMTLDRVTRHKAQSTRLLFEKSMALIKAFEAGTRTGMMNMGWDRESLENLLHETASLPDISYLFIVDKEGNIIVHNDMAKVGQKYGQDLNLKEVIDSDQALWRIRKDGTGNNIFEAYKKFSPVIHSSINTHRNMMMHQRMDNGQDIDFGETVIFVGLDMKEIEQADQNDIQHAVMMGVILLLIGLTGFILVFIFQRYQAARSSLSQIKIFSDTLVENMPMGLVAMDDKDRIILVNPAAGKLLGLDRTENFTNNLEKTLPKPLMELIKSTDFENRPFEKEIRLIHGESLVILDTVVSPLKNKDGSSLGSLLILRDLTELSLLKNENERNMRLAAIGRVAAGVAHEIRNPLSSLKGYATFFKEVFEKGTENYTIADVIITEVDRLDRVVGELVEIARPVQISGKPVNPVTLIEDSIRIIEPEAMLHHISIETSIDNDIGSLHADEDRLKQVLLNLYLNAIQAMEDSGILEVRLFREQATRNIVIIVSDSGNGIKKEDLPNIFEPYFTTKQSGTGLGLAIVHNIIQAHKGEIKVQSEPGKGTVFTLILPDKESDKND